MKEQKQKPIPVESDDIYNKTKDKNSDQGHKKKLSPRKRQQDDNNDGIEEIAIDA